MANLLFWFSLLSIWYTYFGYYLLLEVLAVFRSRPVKKRLISPSVSFIVTVYNEEVQIRDKIINTLAQDYPEDKLQIIIASDCSTDQTESIVESFQNEKIKLIKTNKRRGKEFAQKEALQHATGEIVIFSDVATLLEKVGVKNIVKNFADPTVGCVSSEDKFITDDGKASGEGAYVRYEMALRNLESRVNSLVGLSGSFFATRKSLCNNFSGEMQSDFITLINCIKEGYRGISDPDAIGFYKDVTKNSSEFDRKVRTVLRGMTVFFKNLEVLDIFKYKFFSIQILSHKLIRWLVPIFMILLFFSNAHLLEQSLGYKIFFLLQSVFYLSALSCFFSNTLLENKYFKIPYFFLTVNFAIIKAWLKLFVGKRVILWEPSKRD